VSLDKVDEEAERLEHVLSEELEERIAQTLGDPTHDPHGHPIPSREGQLNESSFPVLADLPGGAAATIVHVSDQDASVLRRLAADGLLPGAHLRVVKVDEAGGMRVRLDGGVRHVPRELAQAVQVSTRD
jgi:DtxR family Mn-dependent transcriptional regulator